MNDAILQQLHNWLQSKQGADCHGAGSFDVGAFMKWSLRFSLFELLDYLH